MRPAMRALPLLARCATQQPRSLFTTSAVPREGTLKLTSLTAVSGVDGRCVHACIPAAIEVARAPTRRGCLGDL